MPTPVRNITVDGQLIALQAIRAYINRQPPPVVQRERDGKSLAKGGADMLACFWRFREPNMRIVVLLILALLAGAAGVALTSGALKPALACSANGGC
jgi:hypothetical protein